MSGIINSAGSKSGIIGDNNLKQYDLTVSGSSATLTGTVAKGIPYKTLNGIWWLRANIKGTIGSYTNNIYDVTINGITWPENYYAVALEWQGGQSTSMAGHAYTYMSGSNAQIKTIWNGVFNIANVCAWSFDAPLTGKPTWAD